MQIPAAHAIRNLGFRLIVSDQDSNCPCATLADEFILLDTFDIQGHITAADKMSRKWSIQGVFTAGADCHLTVSVLAKHLGCHGIAPDISKKCRFKHKTRRLLEEARIPQPSWTLVRTFSEAQTAAARIGGPFVVKATDNSGSRGFKKLNHPDELTVEVFESAIEAGTTRLAIVEEALSPPDDNTIAEQSVETLWFNGVMYWLNWVDRLFSRDTNKLPGNIKTKYTDIQNGIEVGHVNPSQRPRADIQKAQKLMEAAGRALGLHKERRGHILKGDIFWTSKGPILLELAPRLSGGWDSAGTTPARGANFINGALHLALGAPLDAQLLTTCFRYRNSQIVAAVLAEIPPKAINCIGRRFALGVGGTQDAAIEKAWRALERKNYID